MLVSSLIIGQVMLVGQDEKQLGALLVPDFTHLIPWAMNKGIILSEDFESASQNKNLRKALKKEVNLLLSRRFNSRRDERVAGVALVRPFSIENGLLTQTLKQKRREIVQRDSKAIKEIFSD